MRTGPKPNARIVPTAALHTSRREHHSALQLSRSARMRAGSARIRASQPEPQPQPAAAGRVGAGARIDERSVCAAGWFGLSRMTSSAVSGFMALGIGRGERRDAYGRKSQQAR